MFSPLPATAVVGAGAVGCYFGGMLARAGVPVTLIGRPAHVEAIQRDGLLLDGLHVHERIAVNASTELAAAYDAHLVLFCVKTTDTEATARALASHLNRASVVVSMQNGVDNVERIRSASGIHAVAAVVYVAAAMTAPGQVKHSGRGDLILGRTPSSPAEVNLDAVAALFERAEVPCRIAAEIRKELWSKMLMNCAYNAVSALSRERYGRIAADAGARELIREIITEAVAVARSEGVALDARAMTEAAYTLGQAMSGALSSTAQDIERGKLTEIDSLNGYVVRHAAQSGIPAPVNRTLYTLIKLLEAQTASSGRA
jgi:2-dehydropantoate 2-reductase